MYNNILYPIDITDPSSWQASLPVVKKHMEVFPDAILHVLTVVSSYGMSMIQQYLPTTSVDDIVDRAKQDLHNFVRDNIPGEIKVRHIIAKGAVYECIIKTAEKIDADLIVMQAHRPELKDYLLGPNAAKVVRHSECSVLVVRDGIYANK